jgi:hypothetical protein
MGGAEINRDIRKRKRHKRMKVGKIQRIKWTGKQESRNKSGSMERKKNNNTQ